MSLELKDRVSSADPLDAHVEIIEQVSTFNCPISARSVDDTL